MAVVSQKTPNLLGGVSEQDERTRRANQGSEQINGLSDPGKGLSKRPPSEYVALLDDDVEAYERAWSHTIDRDLENKYRAIIRDGDLKVFRADTGEEVTVLFPEGKDYLADPEFGKDFKFVSVEDVTYIVNQDFSVSRGTAVAPSVVPEALIYVKTGADDTVYRITLDSFTVEVHTGTDPVVRQITRVRDIIDAVLKDNQPQLLSIDTTAIAQALLTKLQANSQITALYNLERIGSSIYVSRKNGGDFEVATYDGLGDQGMVVAKGSVQNFEDLPPVAKNGFTVQVVNSPGTEADNYWVRFRASGSTQVDGVWEEVPQPGVLVSLDQTTMPHQLALRGTLSDTAQSEGAPPAVVAVNTKSTTVADNWDEQLPDGGGALTALSDTAQGVLHEHGQYVKYAFPGATAGISVDLKVQFRYEPQEDATQRVKLVLERYNAANVLQATLATQFYERIGDEATFADPFTATVTPAAGDYLKMTLTYDGGSTPAAGSQFYFYTFWKNGPLNAIELQYGSEIQLNFREEQMYPGGFYVRVTLDGATQFNYTPTNDATGAVVAAALQALIDANVTYVSSVVSPGIIKVTNASGAAVAAAVTLEFDPEFDAWFPNQDYSGVTMTGSTIYNLTDGSSASVLSQPSGTTISTSGLVGGQDNEFQDGDLIKFTSTGTFFVFRTVDWKNRAAGDDVTNPYPDFVDRKINDLAYYQGRLGVVYSDRIYFTAAGDILQWWRKSAKVLRDDDPIGAESALPSQAAFIDAVPWNNSLYLRSENSFVLVSGDPVLTPRTIRMDLAAELESSYSAAPVVVGRSLFMARPRKPMGIQVLELRQIEAALLAEPQDTTQHCPTYLEGTPKTLVGSGGMSILFVLPVDCTTNVLFVYKFLDNGRERVVASWSQWQLPPAGQILQIDILDGTLGMVIKYPDGVYLETIDLDEAL